MNDNMTDEELLATAIPAATLVLFRERSGLPPDGERYLACVRARATRD